MIDLTENNNEIDPACPRPSHKVKYGHTHTQIHSQTDTHTYTQIHMPSVAVIFVLIMVRSWSGIPGRSVCPQNENACNSHANPDLQLNGNIEVAYVVSLSLNKELKYVLTISVASIKNLTNSPAKKTRPYGTSRN